jgi:hypothetical protein
MGEAILREIANIKQLLRMPVLDQSLKPFQIDSLPVKADSSQLALMKRSRREIIKIRRKK